MVDLITKNEKHYYYSANKQMILLSADRQTEYSIARDNFLSGHGIYESSLPSLVSDYSPDSIRTNLANLRMLLLELTDGCNLACKYCGYRELYENYDRRESRTQSFENIKGLIDYLAELWTSSLNISYNNTLTIGFYGGEPLISFDLIRQTIEYLETLSVSGLNFAYNMTTNAFFLDKYMDFLVEKNFQLLLSLDGNDKNNAYRINHQGKESFDKVIANIFLLKEKYPEYFKDKVNFNTVLHNNNSIEEIYSFFKTTFDKIPNISELNTNGVAPDKKEEFFKMYRNRLQSTEEASGCEGLKEDLFLTDPDIANLDYFIDAHISNTYESYTELFMDISKQDYIPTGTCPPFKRKLFLTVNGKLLACERIGHESPLGYVKEGEVLLDFEKVHSFYSKKYRELIQRCKHCVLWKNCTLCIYYMSEENGKKRCDRFMPWKAAQDYFSYYLSLAEENPDYYYRLVKEVDHY